MVTLKRHPGRPFYRVGKCATSERNKNLKTACKIVSAVERYTEPHSVVHFVTPAYQIRRCQIEKARPKEL